ncbi:MAG: excinuclease ABC subunit UvrC [Defluviitaleaceae bacterium]|nr:excinuclease ABC subunit UvrC [Defluviitaleaceae bacterium]
MADTTLWANIPHKPGIYIMRDEKGAIIYVGKAIDLYKRVRSYFNDSKDIKTKLLVTHIHTIDYVVTDNEIEAFVLENNLIKQHQPKYNIRLKDDKAYPYIKITINERLPRVMYANKRGKDKAKYFGPYVDKGRMREILDLVHRLWPLRRCSKRFPQDFNKDRPCLNHHIGQCKAPCNKLLNEDDYNVFVSEAERFIRGKTGTILERLKAEMADAAEAMEYERAADVRNTITALNILTEKQKVESSGDDADVLALARNKEKDEALVLIFFVRDGKLSGNERFMMAATSAEEDGDILAAFIKQFYSEAAIIPKELLLATNPTDKNLISEWLTNLAGRQGQVAINIPQRGHKRDLLKLAQTNVELTITQAETAIKKEAERNNKALDEIAESIGLPGPLTRIEAYDISNIQGYESVGSMIVFEDGTAKKSDYRKFKLKAVVGPDDYAGMEEILTRRLARYQAEHTAFAKLPDIIFVDGGKGQITAAKKALTGLGMDLPVAGMVKDDRHRTRGLVFEGNEAALPRHSEGFKLITRIQDEVHRFALEYHRKLRADSQVRSVLDDIGGIGPTRRKALLRHFKSIEAIMEADIDCLTSAPSMNKASAEAVYNFFHTKEEQHDHTIPS